jgi:PKD repeat protein
MSEITLQKKILAVLFMASAPAWAADPSEALAFVYDDGAGNTMPYRLFLPPGYDPALRYPLVLFLHGAGECGTDNEIQIGLNPADLIAHTQSERFASFLVAPQSPDTERAWYDWSTPLIEGILDDVMAGYPNVDERRLYVTGLSMGGFGTLTEIYRHPEKYAAAVPIASGLPKEMAEYYAPFFWKVPIWIFHGAADDVVPVQYSRDLVKALQDLGGDPHYTEYPDVLHDSWFPAYADAEDQLYPWLFAQRIQIGPQSVFTVLPDAGEAPLEICFDAGASTLGDDAATLGFHWDFGDGNLGEGVAPCHTYAAAGRYPITLLVQNDLGKQDEATRTVTVRCAAEDVSPWSAVDVGSTAFPGTARLVGGGSGVAICAGGGTFGAANDALHFVHQQISGSATLSARIDFLEGSETQAQLGVMVREGLEANARCAAVRFTRASSGETSVGFRFRESPASWLRSSGETLTGVQAPNVWMKIVRRGDEFTGYASTDGSAWTELATETLPGFLENSCVGVFAMGNSPLSGQGFRALHAEIRDLSLVDCQTGRDTRCNALEITGPDGGGPGIYTVTASAEDASGDPISYFFTAEDGLGSRLTVGPQLEETAEFDLGEGTWTISVTVDDQPSCLDVSTERCQVTPPAPGGLQRPGDLNQDGKLDLSDAVWLLGHLFLGSPGQETLPCEGGTASSPGQGDLALADVNGDGGIDVSDPVSILGFLFLGGPPPALGTECVRIAGCRENDSCRE